MQIKLEEATMPDELYNELLQNFVNKAVELGLNVQPNSQFKNWTITADFVKNPHLH